MNDLDLETKENLDKRLSSALSKPRNPSEAKVISREDLDKLTGEIHRAEERIENRDAAEHFRKTLARIAATAKERKKFRRSSS